MALYFFSHGLRYLTRAEQQTIARLQPGVPLQLTADDDNAHDRYALSLETAEPVRVGYCPRYLNQDLRRVQAQTPICLKVERVNPDAPLQFRLLCKALFVSPKGFELYATAEHRSLACDVMAATA
jgi:hypothetical protein